MTDHDTRHEPEAPVRILLVEDDPGDVLIIRESLQEAAGHCELSVVENGEEALDFLHRRGTHVSADTPHLVLLDLNLPRVGGHEVLAHMKADAELAPIPVVVLTTSSAQSDIVQTYQLQGSAHITKPVDYDQFHQVVRTIDEFYLNVAALPVP